MSLSQGNGALSCPGAVELGILLPHLAGVIVEEVTVAAGLLLVLARARAATAACPGCGTASGRVHSRYERRLADAAVGGRQVEIRLAVRRFSCPDRDCGRRTFAEQVDGLTTRYARKTTLLAGLLGRIAVALAGRAGSRLASALGAPASRQVMLRLVMAIPDPAAPPLRVVGVDDFAIRRGQHYGTLLIDCETGAPLDLIEGRDAQPLADWLAARPGVEIICRDRVGSYAEGVRTGGAARGPGRGPVPPVEEPRGGRREMRRRPPRLPARTRRPARRGRFPGSPGGHRAAGAVGEVRRARETQPCPGPRPAGRGPRYPGDRPAPGLGTAHRPALRARRHLGGTRRGSLAAAPAQRPDTLTEDEKPRLKALLDRCPELQAASDQVRGFARMMTELTGQDLPKWMADARAAGLPGISSFAKGLEQDLHAVTNGLTMNWSSGPVEGRVNHIKMVKRQMFGRAGLPLLRKRVLLTARH